MSEDWKSRFLQAVDNTASQTLNLRANQIAALDNLGGNLSVFLPQPGIHLQKASMGKYSKREDVPDDTYRKLFSALQFASVLPYAFPIFEDEYSAFMTDVLCGAYSSARRTLRWLLETSIWVCDFQTDPDMPTAPMICSHILETGQGVDEYERYVTFLLMAERINFAERYRGPKLGTVITELVHRGVFSGVKDPTKRVTQVWHELSRYSHLSPQTFHKRLQRDPNAPRDAIVSRFDEKLFDNVYELAMKVMDIIFYLMLRIDVHYFGYSSVEEYVREYRQSPKPFHPLNSVSEILKLPYFQRTGEKLPLTNSIINRLADSHASS